jgi:hypothetical protein
MSNTAYPKGAERILSGPVNLSIATIKAALVASTYTYSAAHEYLSSLGALVGTAQTLTNQSVVGGVFDADDVDFGALAPGATIKAVVLYLDTGNAATSPLLYYFDTVYGLPMNTNGGGITVPWNNGPAKICIDPAEPAQVRPLMQMPQRVFSCSAPDAGAGGCRSGSSRRSAGWHAAAIRSGADARIAP